MTKLEWINSLIFAIPLTLMNLSDNLFENLGIFIGNYIMIFIIIYIIKLPFNKKEVIEEVK